MSIEAQSAPICIILLNFNGWKDTLACVHSLFQSTLGFTQLVICDNASSDGSLKQLRRQLAEYCIQYEAIWKTWHPQARGLRLAHLTKAEVEAGHQHDADIVLIDNQANIGFAAGNNVALKLALRQPSLKWFWLLNNDTEVTPHTLAALLQAAVQRPHIGLWGNTVIYHDRPDVIQALGGGALNWRTAESHHLGAFSSLSHQSQQLQDPAFVLHTEKMMDYPLGASMLATRDWLNDVGLLEESYFLYYEEADWAKRGRHQYPLGYAAQAYVYHKEGASIGTSPTGGTPFSVLHLHRSRLLFARLHLPPSIWPWVIGRSLWQSLKMALKGHFPQAQSSLKGLWQGLTHKLPPA